jgi:hypothetical protein
VKRVIKKSYKHSVGEKGNIGVIRIKGVMIGSVGEAVGGHKFCTRNMMEFNIKHGENQLPAGLTVHELLSSLEIEQILVISKNDNQMRVAFRVMAPFGECTNYGK